MLSVLIKAIARAGFRALALFAAFSLSTYRDLDFYSIQPTVEAVWHYALVFVAIGIIWDFTFKQVRSAWRYASTRSVLVNIRTSTITVLIFLIAVFVLDRAQTLPRSTFILTWVFDICLFSAALLLRRAVHERTFTMAMLPFIGGSAQTAEEDLLLVGSADSADAFLREIIREPSSIYRPIGLIVPNPQAANPREIGRIPVLGSMGDVTRIVGRFAQGDGRRAILFLDDGIAPSDFDAELITKLRTSGVRMLRRRASVDVLGAGSTGLRELDLDDLLSRPPVALDMAEIRRLISGKRILVTGAGGSIGSEICRQVSSLGCGHLTLLDNSEFALFKIGLEIGDRYPTMSRKDVICDIRDAKRLNAWFQNEAPDIVFHAAALKHVPLMEEHPCESVLTNVAGTWNVATAARANQVAHMVFISTDKAVAPSNVMGATKRLAESAVRAHRSGSSGTSFSVVRFGNVLGSAGSVVPTFLSQIKRGGPVTVTHPDVERYFMTIPEAVQLVLHATSSSQHTASETGLYVLDMGQPIRIMDLARRLIDLTSEEGQKIEIQITGLRPGEKLTEELVDTNEIARRCNQGVFELSDNSDARLSKDLLERLKSFADAGDEQETRALVFELLSWVRTGSGSSNTIQVRHDQKVGISLISP